jgi:biopolymer transport protein ExbD/biopolymer transport protein TolR
MAMAAGNENTGGTIADINVTPMVDIMLVLLIIFMVVTPLLQKGVSVDLAKTKNPREMREADRDDATLVAITKDGKIFLKDHQVAKERLAEEVKDLLAAKIDKTVYVRSDRRARSGDVKEVVDIVRTAGVDALGLLTEKVEDRTTQ